MADDAPAKRIVNLPNERRRRRNATICDAMLAVNPAEFIIGAPCCRYESPELVSAREVAAADFARRLADCTGEDVADVVRSVFSLSSNLGALLDSPVGQTVAAHLVANALGNSDARAFVPPVH